MRFRSRVLQISVLALGAVCVPFSAQAGFEWVAPKEDMSGTTLQLPAPKPGTPLISPQPLDTGLDPLPPLSIDQEGGTRDTVYGSAPRRAMPPVVTETPPAARLRNLHMGASESAPAALSAPAQAPRARLPVMDNSGRPRQLRMADELVVPSDVDMGLAPSAAPAPARNVAINPAPLAAPAASAYAPPASAPVPSGGPVLEGFGSDIPLVMALQQIVPPDYTYSFGSGVNPGESVSWEGGKNWAHVLGEMLENEGLKATIKGRSIQIQAGAYAPRADNAVPTLSLASSSVASSSAAVSNAVAEKLAATMPAAGDAPDTPDAAPVEKVEAVPPVYPPEISGKQKNMPAPAPASAFAPVPAPAVSEAVAAALADPAEAPARRVLGSISEKNGLRIEEINETVQVEGSPEAARAARQSVVKRALGLVEDSPVPGTVSGEVSSAGAPGIDVPSIETTSFSVTKTTRRPADAGLLESAAAPVSAPAQVRAQVPKVEPVSSAPAEKAAIPANVKAGDIKKALPGKIPAADAQALRRMKITDPGEQATRQPEVQALRLKALNVEDEDDSPAAATAMGTAVTAAAARPSETASAQLGTAVADMAGIAPAAGPDPQNPVAASRGASPGNPSRDEQRKKLEDMARQQGVVLDAKNYNPDTLGKIFNNGLAPAAGGR